MLIFDIGNKITTGLLCNKTPDGYELMSGWVSVQQTSVPMNPDVMHWSNDHVKLNKSLKKQLAYLACQILIDLLFSSLQWPRPTKWLRNLSIIPGFSRCFVGNCYKMMSNKGLKCFCKSQYISATETTNTRLKIIKFIVKQKVFSAGNTSTVNGDNTSTVNGDGIKIRVSTGKMEFFQQHREIWSY